MAARSPTPSAASGREERSEPLREVRVEAAQRSGDTYWRKARRLTVVLLAAWFVSTFCVIYFARELSHITLFGWPFPFYMASQGLILFYVIIVGVYAKCMQRLDRSLKRDGDSNGK